MHRRRASGSLGVEVPGVMEKGKWMFESEVSPCLTPYRLKGKKGLERLKTMSLPQLSWDKAWLLLLL
jgi:hypothetical protein